MSTGQVGVGAFDATVAAVSHDVPTDPEALRAKRRLQAVARYEAAERAVVTCAAHLEAAASPTTKAKEQAALAAARSELKAARAALKGT